MYGNSTPPKPPRNGRNPVVGTVSRISGGQNQKEASLVDQMDHAEEIANEVYPNQKIEYRPISTTGKGERLDRAELKVLEDLLRRRELDLLIAEDLGRIVRGAEAAWILGIAVDHGTRVISPNDCIDTDDPNWEADALEACKDHVQYNAHNSKRIKYKLMNRFVKYGAAAARQTFGYIVPDDAETYDDWSKAPGADSILRQAYQLLLETLNCTLVADWLNAQGVPVGTYCRRKTWSGAMVRRLFNNSLLKGKPRRGYLHTVKHHETGRRVSVLNPKGPKYYECPHLAFFTDDELDTLNARLAEKNADFRRSKERASDPLLCVPRKRTCFPGQHAICWYCGRHYVWGGNGVADCLMCTGARQRCCWSSAGFNGEMAATKLVDGLVAWFKELKGFESQFTEMVKHACETDGGGLAERWNRLNSDEDRLKSDQVNVAAAIQDFGPKPYLKDKVAELDERQRRLTIERADLNLARGKSLAIPDSLENVWDPLQAEFSRLATVSPEFGDMMRRLVPEFHVYLVRLCDGGPPMPRARVRLNLGGCVDGFVAHPNISEWLSRTLTIDIFTPPPRERIRLAAVALATANPGISTSEIAARLPERVSPATVSQALALQAKMLQLGLSEPFVLLQLPPDDYPKFRRHRHPLYRFDPLPGYRPPEL